MHVRVCVCVSMCACARVCVFTCVLYERERLERGGSVSVNVHCVRRKCIYGRGRNVGRKCMYTIM